MKILITCPPMLKNIDEFRPIFREKNIELICPNVIQTLSETELIALVPQVDGWIIGDDPANAKVFAEGKAGNLKAAVKWGVGIDNVDFKAAAALDIPISNTPGMFGEEVSDIAVTYLIGLARQTYLIDRKARQGIWFKPPGMSLTGKKVAVIGYGDIGKATARKLKVFGLDVFIYDPFVKTTEDEARGYKFGPLDETISQAQFLVVTCSLNKDNLHLINAARLAQLERGAFVVNVSRGPLIDEAALIDALQSGHVAGAGLDVFETEPLPIDSKLKQFDQVIFGSHNGSHTLEGVRRASQKAIDILFTYLGIK